jgi:hypothetical protein
MDERSSIPLSDGPMGNDQFQGASFYPGDVDLLGRIVDAYGRSGQRASGHKGAGNDPMGFGYGFKRPNHIVTRSDGTQDLTAHSI